MTLTNNNYLETDIAFHYFVFLLFYLTDKKDFFFNQINIPIQVLNTTCHLHHRSAKGGLACRATEADDPPRSVPTNRYGRRGRSC